MQFSRLNPDGLSSATPIYRGTGDYIDIARQYAQNLSLSPGQWIMHHLSSSATPKKEVVAAYLFTVHEDGSVTEGIELGRDSTVDVSHWPPRSRS